jgi:two-component system cell cycle sensor histidine kinase/response regulator CckA
MSGPFTILLVEDDSAVREVVVEILLRHGFQVLVASQGYEAIRLLVGQHVDVMLTDIMMPGLSGYELAAQAKLIRPSLRILYTSGYEGQAAGRDMAAGYGKLLAKPVRADQLIGEIMDLLKA